MPKPLFAGVSVGGASDLAPSEGKAVVFSLKRKFTGEQTCRWGEGGGGGDFRNYFCLETSRLVNKPGGEKIRFSGRGKSPRRFQGFIGREKRIDPRQRKWF